MDLRDFQLTIPVLEYHNNTWTWQDFANKFKSEVKNILLQQVSYFYFGFKFVFM